MKALKITGIGLALIILIVTGLVVSGQGQKLALKAFGAYGKPEGDFRAEDAVQAPNYSKEEFWASLPSINDPADLVPAGITAINQGEGEVDTFFIHPTGYLKSASWTSPMDPDSATEENTSWMMANQASAYNGCCNVYAPRYREATIFSYFVSEEEREEVLSFAYEDVKKAFEYYIEHHNNGRPFIISSHSQGTHHAKRLLKEVIDSSDLHERLVAAYAIGSMSIPLSPSWFASMKHIKACQSATDLNCVVHWATMAEGSDAIETPEETLCTNPLTWKVNEDYAEASLNEGAVIPVGTYNLDFGKSEDLTTGQTFDNLEAPLAHQTDAQCRNGTLFTSTQAESEFDVMGAGDSGNYHGLDYALFYMNIHNNAKLRVKTFLEKSSYAKKDSGAEIPELTES
jgi:Protein of unknown function (DUF3089)